MYHYTECGLRNIWLANGYHVHKTHYGKGVSIEHVDSLQRAIAQSLVRKAARLTGAEFRFLRKEQDLSQKGLAELIGCTIQQVTRWENNKVRVPKWADRWLRVIYREYADNNPQIRGFVDRLNEADARESARRQFAHEDSNWSEAA